MEGVEGGRGGAEKREGMGGGGRMSKGRGEERRKDGKTIGFIWEMLNIDKNNDFGLEVLKSIKQGRRNHSLFMGGVEIR